MIIESWTQRTARVGFVPKTAVAGASTGSLIGGWSVLWDAERRAHVREIRGVLHYGTS